MAEIELTEQEMVAYHESPRTFFGRTQDSPDPVSDAFKLYDRIHTGYRTATKEELLQLLAGHPEHSQLAGLSQEQLAALCAEQMTETILQDAFRSTQPK